MERGKVWPYDARNDYHKFESLARMRNEHPFYWHPTPDKPGVWEMRRSPEGTVFTVMVGECASGLGYQLPAGMIDAVGCEWRYVRPLPI
jgi:hypothetical protein